MTTELAVLPHSAGDAHWGREGSPLGVEKDGRIRSSGDLDHVLDGTKFAPIIALRPHLCSLAVSHPRKHPLLVFTKTAPIEGIRELRLQDSIIFIFIVYKCRSERVFGGNSQELWNGTFDHAASFSSF